MKFDELPDRLKMLVKNTKQEPIFIQNMVNDCLDNANSLREFADLINNRFYEIKTEITSMKEKFEKCFWSIHFDLFPRKIVKKGIIFDNPKLNRKE